MSKLKVTIDYVRAKNVITKLRENLYDLDVYLKELENTLDAAVFKDQHKSDPGTWPNG